MKKVLALLLSAVMVLGLLAVISGYLALADSYSLPIFANMRLAAAPRS